MSLLLRAWVGNPAAEALARTLLHFLWEASAIAAVLAVALRMTHSPRIRYAVAVGALAALALAFGATLLITAPHPHTVVFARPYLWSIRLAPPSGAPPGAQPGSPGALCWLTPIWMLGVLLCYLHSFTAWAAAQRLRHRGVCAAPAVWQERMHELAGQIRISRPVLLLESCLTEIPVTIGWIRPVILLPVGLLTGLPAGQVEAILLHELGHIRRYDYAVNLLQTLVEGLLFYHPAVWWISRVIRAEREDCCDDIVVARRMDARTYAAALARLEHRRSAAREALAANGGNLMKRIRRLMGEPQPERRRSLTAAAFGIGLLLATAAAAAVAWAPAPGPSAPPASAQEPQPAPRSAAEPPSPYQKWMNEDVVYIITDAERAVFAGLQTDAEREQFIVQFWKRRDPTPDTPENEMKEEHYRRIAFANQHFSTKGRAGWRTDRGRIYIIYGPPDELEDHHTAAPPAVPSQLWLYRHLDGVGDNVKVEFDDPNRDGEFTMNPFHQ